MGLSLLQVLINAAVHIILYRLVVTSLGVAQLGVWSVVMSITSMTSLVNSGLSGAVTTFVARFRARDELERISAVIQTTVLTTALGLAVFLPVVYFAAHALLSHVMPLEMLSIAVTLLPWSLLGFWLTSVAEVFLFSLDGYQRADLRCVIYIVANLTYLAMCIVGISALGVTGLAVANAGQGFILVVGGILLLRQCLGSFPVLPRRWDGQLLRQVLAYGFSFQIISLTQVLYDPVTKTLLARFGGLDVTGYYEMSSRLIGGLRSLIAGATKVLIPTAAHLLERNPLALRRLYVRAYRLVLYVAVPLFALTAGLAPVISEAWIGRHEQTFVYFCYLLSFGWLVSVLTGPAAFISIGLGELRWNTGAHVAMAVANVLLGLLFGSWFGGIGVVLAWAVSLLVGSLIVGSFYHRRHHIPFREFLPYESLTLTVACCIGLIVDIGFYYYSGSHLAPAVGLVVLGGLFVIVVTQPMMQHPLGKWVASQVLTLDGR